MKLTQKIVLFQFAILLGLSPNLWAQGIKPSPASRVDSQFPDTNLGPPGNIGAPVVNATPLPDGLNHRARDVSLDEVLAWRTQYEDLLGKDFALTGKRFGLPDTAQNGAVHSSVKVKKHVVEFYAQQSKLADVIVYPKEDEDVGIVRVLVKARLFCFRTGTWTNSTRDFFEARSLDGRNVLQFAIFPNGIRLERVMFLDSTTAKPCEPENVAP